MNTKHKEALRVQKEKARADTRNQVDNVKNDMARGKAEWEREKKRL